MVHRYCLKCLLGVLYPCNATISVKFNVVRFVECECLQSSCHFVLADGVEDDVLAIDVNSRWIFSRSRHSWLRRSWRVGENIRTVLNLYGYNIINGFIFMRLGDVYALSYLLYRPRADETCTPECIRDKTDTWEHSAIRCVWFLKRGQIHELPLGKHCNLQNDKHFLLN